MASYIMKVTYIFLLLSLIQMPAVSHIEFIFLHIVQPNSIMKQFGLRRWIKCIACFMWWDNRFQKNVLKYIAYRLRNSISPLHCSMCKSWSLHLMYGIFCITRRLCILWNFTGRRNARHKSSSECFIGQPCDGYNRCRREVCIFQVRHPSRSSWWQWF